MSLLNAIIFAIFLVVSVRGAPQSDGKYDFEFDTGSQFRKEKRLQGGRVSGEYGFQSPNGCFHVTRYEADQDGGYRVLGTETRDCGKPIIKPAVQKTTPPPPTTRPSITTRRPVITTRRPVVTTRRPVTTTRQPDITTRRPQRPPPIISLPPASQVVENNRIEAQAPRDRQLGRPTTPRPPTTTPPPPPVITQKDRDDSDYSFGFNAPGHGHEQVGLPGGVKKGEYYWDSPDGWRRIVSYVATKKGFFPKMRRVRIPKPSTPAPPPGTGGRSVEGGESDGSDPLLNPEDVGKQLGEEEAEVLAIPVGGCPYYFYYNTRIHYHWEHCHVNGTKTGEYGRLAEDGYRYKVWYLADSTGYHPELSKYPLTPAQEELMHEITEGAYVIPKPEEEQHDTERRIQGWITENRQRVDEPLQ